MSRKVTVDVMYGVTYPFVCFFQVLLVVYIANILQLIALYLLTGLL